MIHQPVCFMFNVFYCLFDNGHCLTFQLFCFPAYYTSLIFYFTLNIFSNLLCTFCKPFTGFTAFMRRIENAYSCTN